MDGSAQWRGSYQIDLGVVGEVVLEFGALLFAKLCEFWVGEDVVCGCEVVVALL